MNLEGIYYTTTGTVCADRYAAARAICARARDKADAVLLLGMCGLLPGGG